MYSPDITERRLNQAKKAGLKFQRLPRERSIEISGKLEKLRYNAKGDKLPDGQLVRPLDQKEQEFIESERIICRADFSYYLTRYHAVDIDPGVSDTGIGGIGPGKLQESQLKFIYMMGKREEECHEEFRKYKHSAGILIYAHKCRQVIFTGTARGATMHRGLFWPSTRALAATYRDVGEIYKRDQITIDNLPFWLKPVVYPNVKDAEMGFDHPINFRISYQSENEQTGIGTGTQIDVSHLTEVPLWDHQERIRFSFCPSMPKSIMTLHIQEGTSCGKGDYWQEVTEGCRQRLRGYEDYIYIFVPWYLNTKKWRSNAPDTWTPDEHTVKHAELIERTSPEFCDGRTFRPSRDQLFWWESTRAVHMRTGEVASFLANYPATPEQSFTNFAQGALPVELIEEMEFDVRPPIPYNVEAAA